jgi:hypothetical protein
LGEIDWFLGAIQFEARTPIETNEVTDWAIFSLHASVVICVLGCPISFSFGTLALPPAQSRPSRMVG